MVAVGLGRKKRTCIPAVEPPMADRGGGTAMAELILLDLTCYELLVLVRFVGEVKRPRKEVGHKRGWAEIAQTVVYSW